MSYEDHIIRAVWREYGYRSKAERLVGALADLCGLLALALIHVGEELGKAIEEAEKHGKSA